MHQSDSSQVQNFVEQPSQFCYDITSNMQKYLPVITYLLVTALTIILSSVFRLLDTMQCRLHSCNKNFWFI